MKTKAIQYFSDEYLESCKKLSPEHILTFLDEFRMLHFDPILNLQKTQGGKEGQKE